MPCSTFSLLQEDFKRENTKDADRIMASINYSDGFDHISITKFGEEGRNLIISTQDDEASQP